MDHSDEQLVERAQAGDDDSFNVLMRRYLKPVYRFAQQYARTAEDVEDVVQDSFFKTWKHIKRFKPGASFRPWLYTIVRNTALDYIKKNYSTPFSALDNEEKDTSFAETIEDDEPIQTELFEQAELAGELATHLNTLHPDHRSVLILHYRDDMTFEEIAVIMGIPMNTVKSWHHRALKRIRSQYAPK